MNISTKPQARRSRGQPEPANRTRAPVRFTSNVAGPIYFLADCLSLVTTAVIAVGAYGLLTGRSLVPAVHIFAFVATALTFLLIRASRNAYNRAAARLLEPENDSVIDGVVSVLIASALVWQFGLIRDYSRGVVLIFLIVLVLAQIASRAAVRRLISRLARNGAIQQRIAFYGTDPASLATIRDMLAKLDLTYLRLLGVADDRPIDRNFDQLRFLGGFGELIELARNGQLDHVMICVPNLPPARMQEIVEALSAVSVNVSVIPHVAVELSPNYKVQLLGRIPVLTLWKRPFGDINQFVKTGEDLLIGSLALILVSPVILISAILVKLTSPGPILFVQPRVGFNNEVIDVYKFRTMHVERTDRDGSATTTRGDPRVSAVGRFLRRLSIDELPQLFNVIRGEMSLVGPRPHAIKMKVGDRSYKDAVRGYAGRHRVRPGITGYAQVNGLRGEIRTLERARQRVELDKYYIDHWSIGLDLWIMLSTIRAVIWDRDAY